MVISLERGADLRMAQLMPLSVFCFSKIQIGFTFLVPAHPGSPKQRALKQTCVCVYIVEVEGSLYAKNMLHSISHFDTILGLLAHKYILTCAKILHYANTPTFGGTTAQVAKLVKLILIL